MAERRKSGILATWLVSALSVSATAWLLPGVHIASFFPDALLASLVIGLVNAVVRPLLVLLTLPVTLLSLGLFLLVINGLMLLLADHLLDGFAVDGLIWSVIAALVLSVVSSVLGGVFLRR